jgi:hypothetical protein
LIWKGNTVGYNWYGGHFVGFALDMVGYVEIGTPWAVTPQSGGIAQTALSLTPDGLHVYLAGGSTGPPDNFSKWSTASNTEVAHFPLGVNIDGCAVTPDGSTVVVTDVGSSHVYLWDTATDTLRATVATTDRSLNLVLFPAAPVTTLTVGDLFIPRKGLSDPYTSFDFNADWLAIETWANHSWSTSPPNLFIPCKPSSRPPTVLELNANWHAIEDWADAIGTLNTVAIPPLFIPRKNSLDPTDLGSCFLAIQDWANAL